MEGFAPVLQVLVSVLAVAALVLGFIMGHVVRFVDNSNNSGAPGMLCLLGAVGGAISLVTLGASGHPIISGGLLVSSLVIGVGLGFMTDRRPDNQG
jgi:hypothetical protein